MKMARENRKGDRGKPANKSHFIAGLRHFLRVGARAITKQPVTKTEYPPTAGKSHELTHHIWEIFGVGRAF
jgi:hypothetical protein